MIARLWSARATEARSQDYLQHFQHSVVPELKKLSGYVGSNVLTRSTYGDIEILVTTVWRSLDSILEFAGPDSEMAVVADEAAALLTSYDGRVRHFEVALADGTAPGIP
jgi:heme-degrading monooxygenase HmoA